jgi:predicted nucleotidyltransferase component of viral defense system
MKKVTLNLDDVRRHTIVALAADDDLGELLVLKGGNALRLVYGIGNRSSLDLDYSIGKDLADVEAIRARIESSLGSEFVRIGYKVFDVRMLQKPHIPKELDTRPTWGGWAVEFKLINSQMYEKYANTPAKLRDYAETLYEHRKSFQIDISKFEYVDSAQEVDFSGFNLRVYSLAMIVYEKLRALCQQMKDYPFVAHPAPRPRDFVDICAVLEEHRVEVLDARSIIAAVFAAKEVPLPWLRRLVDERGFHAMGWPSVSSQIIGTEDFNLYFDRVIAFIEELHALGVV